MTHINSEIIVPEHVSCSYIEDIGLWSDDKCSDHKLSILHLNIRSLKSREHFQELLTFLELLPFKPDILVLTETWINNPGDYKYICIPGYNYEFYCRESKSGGGIAMFLMDKLCYKKINDMVLNEAESVFIEIKLQKGKVILGSIYRPPDSSINKFIDSLDKLTDKIQIK